MQKDLVEQLQIQKVETREKKTVDAIRKPVEIHYSLRAEEKLDQMDHKLDELLEIKKLYEDMLDWMVELAKESRNRTNRDMSSTAHDTSIDQSILSPRLKQVLDVVKARGEILAEDAVQSTGLSLNRCSEILNALYRANFIEKHRVGREVYYRVNAGGAAKLTQDAGA
jgi:DNA-binding transcriptional ArsR family regulator